MLHRWEDLRLKSQEKQLELQEAPGSDRPTTQTCLDIGEAVAKITVLCNLLGIKKPSLTLMSPDEISKVLSDLKLARTEKQTLSKKAS
jgi:hypothetical protein